MRQQTDDKEQTDTLKVNHGAKMLMVAGEVSRVRVLIL
jgi:hypothetical protein